MSHLNRCASIQGQITVPLDFNPWGRHNEDYDPLPRCFPTKAGGRNDWLFAFDVHTNPDDELEVGVVNVGAAGDERHVEIVRHMAKSGVVSAGLPFNSEQD